MLRPFCRQLFSGGAASFCKSFLQTSANFSTASVLFYSWVFADMDGRDGRRMCSDSRADRRRFNWHRQTRPNSTLPSRCVMSGGVNWLPGFQTSSDGEDAGWWGRRRRRRRRRHARRSTNLLTTFQTNSRTSAAVMSDAPIHRPSWPPMSLMSAATSYSGLSIVTITCQPTAAILRIIWAVSYTHLTLPTIYSV